MGPGAQECGSHTATRTQGPRGSQRTRSWTLPLASPHVKCAVSERDVHPLPGPCGSRAWRPSGVTTDSRWGAGGKAPAWQGLTGDLREQRLGIPGASRDPVVASRGPAGLVPPLWGCSTPRPHGGPGSQGDTGHDVLEAPRVFCKLWKGPGKPQPRSAGRNTSHRLPVCFPRDRGSPDPPAPPLLPLTRGRNVPAPEGGGPTPSWTLEKTLSWVTSCFAGRAVLPPFLFPENTACSASSRGGRHCARLFLDIGVTKPLACKQAAVTPCPGQLRSWAFPKDRVLCDESPAAPPGSVHDRKAFLERATFLARLHAVPRAGLQGLGRFCASGR